MDWTSLAKKGWMNLDNWGTQKRGKDHRHLSPECTSHPECRSMLTTILLQQTYLEAIWGCNQQRGTKIQYLAM